MKTIYIANDGKEFTNKEECKEYEKTPKNLMIFDIDGKQIPLNTSTLLEDIEYIFVRDKQGYEKFYNILGVYLPDRDISIGNSLFCYDEDRGGWYFLDDTIVRKENELKELKDIRIKLQKKINS